MASPAAGNYYDILLIGNTGIGKTTTGKKIVPSSVRASVEVCNTDPADGTAFDKCQLLCNDETGVRVLDTPGFSASDLTNKYGVYGGNLRMIRSIIRSQLSCNLKPRRILYFLPTRGPIIRAGGVLQEEIQVMYEYFGTSLFKIMVIIATFDEEQSDKNEFTDKQISKTSRAFMDAYAAITGESLPRCPPILYVPLSERDILPQVKSAEVIDDIPLITLYYENTCVKCAAKLVYGTERKHIIQVETQEGEKIDVDDSKCHPSFIPKYSTLQKIIGVLLRIVTLYYITLFPWFNNNEEICINCKNPPGSEGCTAHDRKRGCFHSIPQDEREKTD